MNTRRRCFTGLFCVASVFLVACGATIYQFSDSDPVKEVDDKKPVPVPRTTHFDPGSFKFKALVQRPINSALSFADVQPSRDVNSMDDVPASSWYTPRLGYSEISANQLVNGPFEYGPPQKPITVVKAKVGGGNPGFIITDKRGKRYLVKFDPPGFPGIETTTAVVVNRLFWGFGYNVPEDYLFWFREDELTMDPKGELTQKDIDEILDAVSPPVDGSYRATASLLLEGMPLGPIRLTGSRVDDPNDLIRHDNRRVMRALRVFCAFTNQSGIRPDNSLDMYLGKAGEGYVKHFFLDFGEAFGGHGAGKNWTWDGYNHIFSFKEAGKNIATLGLDIETWEDIDYTQWKSVGAFEADVFNPANWKPVYPYEPINHSQPADDYWAAKIVAAITADHLATLVKAADYPEPGAAEYIVATLQKRRDKIVRTFFSDVSPIEFISLNDKGLQLSDLGRVYISDPGETVYKVSYYDHAAKSVAPGITVVGEKSGFTVPIPGSVDSDYLRVEVLVHRGGRPAPSTAQFHFRKQPGGNYRLVGVVH